MVGYHVAKPDEYLAITGMGIQNVKITKRSMVYPFQRTMRFSVKPHDYAINLQAMTKEKLQFLLPVIFTIGPDTGLDDAIVDAHHMGADHAVVTARLAENSTLHQGHALMKYAMLLASDSTVSQNYDFLEGIVKGIVEGETRVLVSSLTMEEIFTERETFKSRIFKNIQTELLQFGLKVFNANLKELKDAPNSVYFESLSRKAHEGATQQAKIDVAEAVLRGTIGESSKRGQMERELAKINAETAVQKTQRDVERATAEAELYTRQTELTRDVDITRTMAKRAIESRDEDLKKEVEIKRAAAAMERMRGVEVVKATIGREARQQEAEAAAYEVMTDAKATYEKMQRQTDAAAYKIKIDADADFERVTRITDASAYKTKTDATVKADADYLLMTRTADAAAYKFRADADAWSYSAAKRSEAGLIQRHREAEGMIAMAEGYAKMSEAFGGPAGLLQFMMIEKGMYIDMAKANAEAVRGMAPKISVWTTGPSAGADGSSSTAAQSGQPAIDTMRNVYQMLPPLMSTINDQTGITLPEWQFGRLATAPTPTPAGPVAKRANDV